MRIKDSSQLYERLVQLTAIRNLKIKQNVVPLTRNEISRLLFLASSLSLSAESDDASTGYDICSRIIELYADDVEYVAPLADVILSRMGNFPGRSLLRKKYKVAEMGKVPHPLALERLARESENSVDEDLLLTDFQFKLYSALAEDKVLSVSAPTSAGKSFVLNLDLIRRLESESSPLIIYVVPTRALVSEVVDRIRGTLQAKAIEKIAVRTAPFPLENSERYRGAVYVLTQERLLRLLSWVTNDTPPTALIIDEAHELEKGKRGILLQNAVDIMIAKFPGIAVLFACPLIKNPGYLLDVFHLHKDGHYFVEEVSPVSQNIMLVSPINGEPNSAKIEQYLRGEIIQVGTATLSFNFRGSIAEQKARFAAEICCEDESVIIFADDPNDAEDTASTIASFTSEYEASPELTSFMKFISTEIHPEHPLIECLKKGVGFHYGHMPSIVRSNVERFFKQGQIKYLCSTSTLLQGVNLPAKHIVILNPRLGGDGMRRADFRNLAGCAGRLLEEFHGQVWCLRPGDWEIASYQGENLQEIQSAMDTVMNNGGVLIGSILEGLDVGDKTDLADAAMSRLFYQVKDSGAEATFASYVNDQNEELLRNNISRLENFQLKVPSKILEMHRSLRPDQLEALLDLILQNDNLENLILTNPHEAGGKGRMVLALSLINNAFEVDMNSKYFNWVSTTAHKWVWGTSIGELLQERVNFIRRKKPNAKASPEIRKLLKLIETEIRYKLVKYFSAFEDLCKWAFTYRGLPEPVMAPYHVYLEFGASEPGPLNLMALGLSRFTALKLAKLVPWPNDRTPEDYLKLIESRISMQALPAPCRQELKEIMRGIFV